MTLGENKKITLGLIEEYSKANPKLTDDEDISTRLNFVYATNYQELSEKKRILKTKVLKEISDEVVESGYTEYTLPSSMYQMKNIIALDENNNKVNTDYYTVGKKKIYINNDSNYQYILEYYAYPTVIEEDTDDDFVLELDQDVLMILPYMVASDILKTDPSADYTAFEVEYRRKLEQLNTSLSTPRATIKQNYIL
jgi:hypothetical protein